MTFPHSESSKMVFNHATLKHFETSEMLSKRRHHQATVNKPATFMDSDWFTKSLSNVNEVYLLHIYEELPLPKVRKLISPLGRIECDCKAFVYAKMTPRYCKHSIELARRVYGETSLQYIRLLEAEDLTEPDEWCSHLYTMYQKAYKPSETKLSRLRAHGRYATIPKEEMTQAREHYAKIMGREYGSVNK